MARYGTNQDAMVNKYLTEREQGVWLTGGGEGGGIYKKTYGYIPFLAPGQDPESPEGRAAIAKGLGVYGDNTQVVYPDENYSIIDTLAFMGVTAFMGAFGAAAAAGGTGLSSSFAPGAAGAGDLGYEAGMALEDAQAGADALSMSGKTYPQFLQSLTAAGVPAAQAAAAAKQIAGGMGAKEALQLAGVAAPLMNSLFGSGAGSVVGGAAKLLGVDDGSGSGSGGFGMPSVKDALGALGIGVGALTAAKALLDDQGKPLRDAAIAGVQASTAIAKHLEAMATEQWDMYKREVVPQLQNLSTLAKTDRTPEVVAQASGETKAAYGTARQNLNRAIEGVRNPGDPGRAAILAPSYMDEASAVSKAIQTARFNEQDRQFNQQVKAVNAWGNLSGQAINTLGAAANVNNAATTTAAKLSSDADARAAQAAYGGLTLAKEAANWMKGTPGAVNTGTPAAAPSGPAYDVANPGGGWTYDEYGNPVASNQTWTPAELTPEQIQYQKEMEGFNFAHGGAVRVPRRYADGGPVDFSHIPERQPYAGEDEYFKANPHVGGMASEGNEAVLLNPYSTLSPDEKQSVLMNERARVHMRQSGVRPNFQISPEQRQAFGSYSSNPQDILETIAARILSGDPSAKATPEQMEWVRSNLGAGQGRRNGGAIRRGYAEGGAISGPGTGTSDSIKTVKEPGTYILSADTVRAIGTKKVDDMLEKAGIRKGFGGNGASPDAGGVSVHVSNGEAAIPKAAVQYYGEQFFHALQAKYHRPVMSDDGMANGGAIRKRSLPRSVEDAILGHVSGAISRRGH